MQRCISSAFCTVSRCLEERLHMLSLVSREGAGSASSHVTHLKFQEGKIKAFLSLEQTRILNTSCGACERRAGHFSKRSGMLLSREVTRREMEMHFLSLVGGEMRATRSRGFVRPCQIAVTFARRRSAQENVIQTSPTHLFLQPLV